MGYNLAGLLINKNIDNEKEIKLVIGNSSQYAAMVDFEEATSSYRAENTFDLLSSTTGTLILMELGQIYDLEIFPKDYDVIQFMISAVSDTYYFESFSKGELVRKLITSQGDTAEDVGEGILTENDDLADKIWELTDAYLQNNFSQKRFDLQFKRYELK
ncbi:hypothetical protein [Flavobacterium sp. '19STA2R22 D10 B1']|uniref:hypothetical protein n=1 Tax=Flavobacterium aerium TaxID=3037261 RepID=UPI00278BD174|nr:hypothetical protein [Flavobacterium sp. '19STA2R22 D10 B1']